MGTNQGLIYQVAASPYFYGTGGTPRFAYILVKGKPFILDQENGALYEFQREVAGTGYHYYMVQIPYHVIADDRLLGDDDDLDEDDEETIA